MSPGGGGTLEEEAKRRGPRRFAVRDADVWPKTPGQGVTVRRVSQGQRAVKLSNRKFINFWLLVYYL